MAKQRNPIDTPIPDLNTPWDDGTNAYTGQRVEEFLKGQISNILADIGGKFGDVIFEGGALKFYDLDGGQVLKQLNLSGSSYIININADCASNFYVLTSQTETIITIRPTTKEVALGSTNQEDYHEDYQFRVEVDSGSGYFDITPASNSIREGESASIDVRRYLTMGINKVRIAVTGLVSEQVKTSVFTANLTSLTMTCNHSWQRAWIEGQPYSINGIFFSGNIDKTLHVKIGGDEYTQHFSSSAQYTSVPYSFDISGYFPEAGTGVYDVEVWMEGGSVVTPKQKFRIMCVTEANKMSARLVCVNNVPEKANNYATQTLFQYATYNANEVTLNLSANIGGQTKAIVTDQQMSVETQTKTPFTMSLQEDGEFDNGTIEISLSTSEHIEQIRLPFDNSYSFKAETGATFYLNPAMRANNRSDRQVIINSATDAAPATHEANWERFTFKDDAWVTDLDGNKCLSVMAGSLLSIPTLKPLANSETDSATVEWMYRVDAVADYDTPIFSIMSTETFDPLTTRGIILMPTRLYVFDSSARSMVEQKLDLTEGRIIHVAVVLQHNYGDSGLNLCRVYINGRENLTYQFSGAHVGNEYSYVRMGQSSSDFYLYMMRTYEKALEPAQVHTNYINALIETASTSKQGERSHNNILDGNAVDYDLCKAAGLNCMVIECNSDIPSFANKIVDEKVNLRLEYNDHPEWNVIIEKIPIAGQGTTSMQYAKWNLTHKIKDSVKWIYPNKNGVGSVAVEEYGTSGYIAGYGLHPKVSKITSKKNIASSPQGHKMGATAFYNDLFAKCNLGAELPENSRVAVYQHPFVGFQYRNGAYEFIGLYTVGPDKKDLGTFGYDQTDTYPNLMMIEGPNHAPLMTRFLVPWKDVFYDYENETLSVGNSEDSNRKQEGWDADIVSNLKTDKADQAADVLDLYESEFKPAYEAIYYSSPYIAPLSATGYNTIEELNNHSSEFRGSGTTNGHKNVLMSFYDDSNYKIIYWRVATGRYEVLEGYDMLADLRTFAPSLSANPILDEILQARAAKFISDKVGGVFHYVNQFEAFFHECFCELLGVSDNHAKNTYWRKFKALDADDDNNDDNNNGGKWGFSQDDLDTIFQNDNNGKDTKDYFVEPNDLNSTGAEIFQGAESAFWYQLRQCCATELKGAMNNIIEQCCELATTLNSSASTTHGKVLDVISYYFWENSAKYFPAMAYNADTQFGYINVWLQKPSEDYNGVKPLTQVHGDHYETERAWVERRIVYIFSKYGLGDFHDDKAGAFGVLAFTNGANFDMSITPAIDLYPCFSVGGPTEGKRRTKAGSSCVFNLNPNTATNVYIKAMDWISDLGNLSGLMLTTRGGESEISFSVSGKRLLRLVIGDENSDNVKFNAHNFSVSGAALETINAQNVVNMKGEVALGNCPRLRSADFRGTSVTGVFPPVGGRVNELLLPDTINTLFLHSLGLLPADGLTLSDPAKANIERFYFNNCPNIDPISLVTQILNKENSKLRRVTLIWDGELTLQRSDDFDTIARLAQPYDAQAQTGFGGLAYNPENGTLSSTNIADIQGTLRADFPVYADSISAITRNLSGLTINYDPNRLYFRFADPEVQRVFANSQYGDGTGNGTLVSAIKSMKDFGTIFSGNTSIRDFSDLSEFENLVQISSYAFSGCTQLQRVSIPNNLRVINSHAFEGCTNLERVDISDLNAWFDLAIGTDNANPLVYAHNLYLNGELIETLSVPEGLTEIKEQLFCGATCIKEIHIPEGVTGIKKSAFLNCAIERIYIPTSLVTVENGAFASANGIRKPITIYISDPSAWCNIDYLFNNRIAVTTDTVIVTTLDETRTITLRGVSRVGEADFVRLDADKVVFESDGEKVTTAIGGNAFLASNIREIEIPNTVTAIGGSAFAFSRLERLIIPDSVTTLSGNGVCQGCKELTYVEIGSGITSLPNYTFLRCSQLQTVILRPNTPPTLGSGIFEPGLRNLRIYVPNDSVNAYKTAGGWSGYASVIFPISDLPTDNN